MKRFALCLLPLFVFAACGPDATPDPVEDVLDDAAAVPDSIVGLYNLYAIDEAPLPGRVGTRDGCALDLTEGTIRLKADAFYALDVLSRTVCEDENDEANRIDRATSEGPFVVEAAGVDTLQIQFSREVIDEDDADEPEEEERTDDEEAEEPDLFDAAAFAGTGVLVDTLLTVRLADTATTLTFVRE